MRPSVANRRRAARLACALSVQYRAASAWRAASALDLSEEGCRLRVGEDLPIGAQIAVRLEAPLRDGATAAASEIGGSVVWCRREGLSYQVGIQFAAATKALGEILKLLES